MPSIADSRSNDVALVTFATFRRTWSPRYCDGSDQSRRVGKGTGSTRYGSDLTPSVSSGLCRVLGRGPSVRPSVRSSSSGTGLGLESSEKDRSQKVGASPLLVRREVPTRVTLPRVGREVRKRGRQVVRVCGWGRHSRWVQECRRFRSSSG